jgi:hypothetical protein
MNGNSIRGEGQNEDFGCNMMLIVGSCRAGNGAFNRPTYGLMDRYLLEPLFGVMSLRF